MTETTYELEIGDIEFVFSVDKRTGVPVFNLTEEKGGYVFMTQHKDSRWMKIAKWIDRKIFRSKQTFQPSQWIDISWFVDGKHIVRSYAFIPIGKEYGKETLAAYAASLGLLYCYFNKDNPVDIMPDYVQTHFNSIFGSRSYVFTKIMDHDVKGDILSSFLVCKSLLEKHSTVKGTSSLH